MPDVTMQQCLEHLVEVFGRRYLNTRGAGLSEMSRELVSRFGLAEKDADTLLAEMEESGLVRHRSSDEPVVAQDQDRYRNPNEPPGTYLANDLLGGVPFHEPVGAFVGGQGVWQIGEE